MGGYDQDTQNKAGLITFAFTLLLALVFIILKLTAVIAWSWWWVLAPLWIPFCLGLLLTILGIKPPQY